MVLIYFVFWLFQDIIPVSDFDEGLGESPQVMHDHASKYWANIRTVLYLYYSFL